MPKILAVFGTRPEAIKMAPVVKALAGTGGLEPITVVTAQHREMLDQVLGLFSLHPDYDLDIMKPRQSLSDVVVRALPGLEEVIAGEKPDAVLVQGDTTTAFAAALAAYYRQIPVGHVEAGLRTGKKYEPFPEEMNRRLIGALADWHFAPTANARQNLLREGVPDQQIFVTGNTVIDAVRSVTRDDYRFTTPQLAELDFARQRVLLVTAHRRENWGEALEAICGALTDLVGAFKDVTVVFPVHKNPVVRETVERRLGGRERVVLTEPLDYGELANLLARCTLVLTDSGGLQEEAPGFGRPVLVLRNVTERPEGEEAGALKLVGTYRHAIVLSAAELLTDDKAYAAMARAVNPFGDGQAAQRIACILAYHFGLADRLPEPFAPAARPDSLTTS
ncbi:MAG: non-hydrolyzing UDP-N-acetylglucosamine 2-epimerase [Betaproteobacteria bacterium]